MEYMARGRLNEFYFAITEQRIRNAFLRESYVISFFVLNVSESCNIYKYRKAKCHSQVTLSKVRDARRWLGYRCCE